MTTLTDSPALKTEKLTHAFHLFNEMSESLSDSYQQLQTQVATLTIELTAARTERLKTLTEKEKSTNRLQQILAALPAAVIVLNNKNSVVECNAIAINYLSTSLIGQNWLDIAQHYLLPVLDNPHERQLIDGKRINITRNKLSNNSGQIILLSNVSELRSLQDKLNQQQNLSAMGEMVASMAHQVRTPLSTALLYASQINKSSLTDSKRIKFSNKILERLHYLERQVDDMLIFAKEGHLAMNTFSLQHLLAQISDNMDELIGNTDIAFQMRTKTYIDTMQGNEDALLGAIMNLLNNAVDAQQGKGKISMSITQKNSTCLQIQIQDTGTGIKNKEKQRLFEPFYTTKTKGSGLGLAVVNSVIRAHNGSIQCKSTLGFGTLFILILPCINQYNINPSDNSIHQSEVSDETV